MDSVHRTELDSGLLNGTAFCIYRKLQINEGIMDYLFVFDLFIADVSIAITVLICKILL